MMIQGRLKLTIVKKPKLPLSLEDELDGNRFAGANEDSH
jgi:hypothetical protein